MDRTDGIVGVVGRTPLIKLRRASEATGCTILGKAEFMNPGQSVKDRAALFMIRDAVAKGQLRPGGAIVGKGRPVREAKAGVAILPAHQRAPDLVPLGRAVRRVDRWRQP